MVRTMRKDPVMHSQRTGRGRLGILAGTLLVLLLATFVGGCSEDDCVTCIQLPPPVVPTGVHSISGDNEVIIQWYDISYFPYDGNYNENVVKYRIYWRFFQDGDENDGNREFEYLGEVAWDENYDDTSGLHWFVDDGALNGERYEYAVDAVNAAGAPSDLSFELVTDAPLPMSILPVRLFDAGAPSAADAARSGFDFSAMDDGVVDPNALGTTADIRVFEDQGHMFVESMSSDIRIQDFGIFTYWDGSLYFEGVSSAPLAGYSELGVLELVLGHIYVLELEDHVTGHVHYAKMGIVRRGVSEGSDFIEMHWAYQLIEGLPELKVHERVEELAEPVVLHL